MDTKQLITEAKIRFNHNSAKSYLKDKYKKNHNNNNSLNNNGLMISGKGS